MLISQAFAHGGSAEAGSATGPLILLGLAVAFVLYCVLRKKLRRYLAARDANDKRSHPERKG